MTASSSLLGLLGLVGVVAAVAGGAAPAAASCASPAAVSEHRFTGVVTSVSAGGRVASVRTEAGDTVSVVGSPSGVGGGVTSVDREYTVGARYEFHPVNAGSPFQDNACTATHEVAAPAASPTASPVGAPGTTPPSAALPGSGAPGEAAGAGVTPLVPAAIGLAVVGAGAAVVLRRRRPVTPPQATTASS